jgi:endo-1,4-beta-mannosidase
MDPYVQEFGVKKTHDEFNTDLNMRAQFNTFVQFIVARYANEPTVMAWELANDPRCNSSVGASLSCNTNTITQWDERARAQQWRRGGRGRGGGCAQVARLVDVAVFSA